MTSVKLGVCAFALAVGALQAMGQSPAANVSDEYEPSNVELLSQDVSNVKLGMAIDQVRAMTTNLFSISQETARKDIETQVQEYAILEASELLHGAGCVWPGWSTVRIWFTRPDIGGKACSISFSKDLGALPDMKALESRLVKKYGAWCRKKVTKQENGALTYRFTWGAFDRQQGRFTGTGPTLDVWVHPSRVEKGEPVYRIAFDLNDPKLKGENQAAVDRAVEEVKIKAAQAIPF